MAMVTDYGYIYMLELVDQYDGELARCMHNKKGNQADQTAVVVH